MPFCGYLNCRFWDKLLPVTAARKSVILERLFVRALRVIMHRRFYGVFVRGLELLDKLDPHRAVLFCTNHSNWWDGFTAALLLSRLRPRRVYLAQYEKLLAHYPPLRWLGVFGIDRDGPAALPGLRRALRLLQDPRNAVWIFPQGVLVPQWRPIEVKPGALWLTRRSGAQVVPVVFRYEWLVESRPSIFVHFGEALPPDASDAALAAAMQSLYDAIGLTLSPFDAAAYTPLYKPRMSMNKWWEFAFWPFVGGRKPFNPRNE